MTKERILYDQHSLEELADLLSSLSGELDSAVSMLNGTNTSRAAGGRRYCGTAIALSGLGAPRVDGGNVRESVQAFSSAIAASSAYMARLGRTVRQVSNLFADAEQAVKANGAQTGGGASSSAGLGVKELRGRATEKARIIASFEREHPEYAKKLNDFLTADGAEGLSPKDIEDIKYLVYTAREPFRSACLKSLGKYSIKTVNGDGGFYQPWPSLIAHTVNYSYPDCFAQDPRGPYTVFFHECGHAIDDLSDQSKWMGSDTESFKAYSEAMKQNVTIQQAIEYDVYHNKNNPHSVSSIAEKYYRGRGLDMGSAQSRETAHVIDAFRSGKTSQLTKDELRLYNHVKNEFNSTTGRNAKYESVTDVYGGVSHNSLRNGGYGHDNSYWDSRSSSMPAQELWAEYFSYNMSDNSENLAHLHEYFPEAAKVMEAYAYKIS